MQLNGSAVRVDRNAQDIRVSGRVATTASISRKSPVTYDTKIAGETRKTRSRPETKRRTRGRGRRRDRKFLAWNLLRPGRVPAFKCRIPFSCGRRAPVQSFLEIPKSTGDKIRRILSDLIRKNRSMLISKALSFVKLNCRVTSMTRDRFCINCRVDQFVVDWQSFSQKRKSSSICQWRILTRYLSHVLREIIVASICEVTSNYAAVAITLMESCIASGICLMQYTIL